MNTILLILGIVIIILLIVVIIKLVAIEDAIDFCNDNVMDNHIGIRSILKLKYNINLEELSDRYWEILMNGEQIEDEEENSDGKETN